MPGGYILLDANPGNAPCCVLLLECDEHGRETGRDVLVQDDWSWPSIAGNFGFVPCNCDNAGSTDGTVDCPCGRTAGNMIAQAREFLDEHDGEVAEDPGYFAE